MRGDDLHVGDDVTLVAIFEDAITSQAIAPEDVRISVRRPDNSLLIDGAPVQGAVDAALGRLLTGNPEAVVFSLRVVVDEPGLWSYRFASVGTRRKTELGTFPVRADPFA